METREITEEYRIQQFNSVFKSILSDDTTEWLIENGFFRQAASTRFHGSYEGGLFDHSYDVMLCLKSLTEKLDLKWGRPESPLIVGMFHDLCKIDQYRFADGKIKYVSNTPIKGHGDKSVILLSRFMYVTEEEAVCIRYHMGAFVGGGETDQYTSAIHKYSNVLWTHTADMMASHLHLV